MINEGHIRQLLYHGEVAWFWKTFRSSDLITTFTYIPLDNFCPWFFSNKFLRKVFTHLVYDL